MRSSIIVSAVLVLVLVVTGFFTYRALHPHESLKNSDAVRDFSGSSGAMLGSYTDLSGAPLDLEQFAGSVRIVNIWATWSPATVGEIALIKDVIHNAATPVTFLAVNRAEPVPKVQAYVARYNLKENVTFVLDQSDAFYQTVGGFAMPETIVYDKKGTKVLHHRGEVSREVLESALQTVIAAE